MPFHAWTILWLLSCAAVFGATSTCQFQKLAASDIESSLRNVFNDRPEYQLTLAPTYQGGRGPGTPEFQERLNRTIQSMPTENPIVVLDTVVTGEGGQSRIIRGFVVSKDNPNQLIPVVIKETLHKEQMPQQAYAIPALIRQSNHPGREYIAEPITYIENQYVEKAEPATLKDSLGQIANKSPAEVLEFVKQLCQGIAAAHASKIVHLDVDPGNILITKEGDVRISDWTGAVEVGTSVNLGGKLGYMHEEQYEKGPAKTYYDTYATGRVIEDMLMGTAPKEHSPNAIAASPSQTAIMPLQSGHISIFHFKLYGNSPYSLRVAKGESPPAEIQMLSSLSSLATQTRALEDGAALVTGLEAIEKHRSDPSEFYRQYLGPQLSNLSDAKILQMIHYDSEGVGKRFYSDGLGFPPRLTEHLKNKISQQATGTLPEPFTTLH